MNILVLGASGMAGHLIATHLREQGYKIETLSAQNALDPHTHILNVVSNMSELKKILDSNNYAVVINCIGLLVKQSEARQDLAIFINSYLPKYLEQHYKETDTKVIHISSDAVFSGRHSPYTENSMVDGASFYSRTKALGEIDNKKDLTLRTSIIGPELSKEGTSLFNWFFSQKGEVSGYSDSMWSGLSTVELAKALEQCIKQNITGIYHLVPNERISKYNLLVLIQKAFGRDDITLKHTTGATLNAHIVNTRKDLVYNIPSYEMMMKQMKSWIDVHQNMYPHYEK